MTTTAAGAPERAEGSDAQAAFDFVARILEKAPVRRPGSADERAAHDLVRAQFEALGLETEVFPFEWNENLYATLALHFGVATLGTLIGRRSPKLALALHALAAASYALDSSRRAFLLRRLFPFKASQNVIATLPARGERKLRVVFLAHADAAFTGLVFEPSFVKRFASKGGPLHKPVRISTMATAALAGLDAAAIAGIRAPWLVRAALAIPPAIAFALNADVTARDHIVPGASDNLSGVAGGWLLAKRFLAHRPEGVELVFVTTGCEEAGLGGSQALLEARRGEWSKSDTVIVTIDGLAGGKLHTFLEGEVFSIPPDAETLEAVARVRASEARFADVTPFTIPVGGTDFVPWGYAGYPGVSVGRVDTVIYTTTCRPTRSTRWSPARSSRASTSWRSSFGRSRARAWPAGRREAHGHDARVGGRLVGDPPRRGRVRQAEGARA
jgi:hypothetical protein